MTADESGPAPRSEAGPLNENDVQQQMVAGAALTPLQLKDRASAYIGLPDDQKAAAIEEVALEQREEFWALIRRLKEERKARVVPPPQLPMAVARHIITDGLPHVVRWRETWMRWDRTCWVETSDEEFRALLYLRLEHATCAAKDKQGNTVEVPFAPNRGSVAGVAEALTACVPLDSTREPPLWHDGWVDRAGTWVSMANGLLELKTRETMLHTPGFFNVYSLPFDYDAQAECPRWLAFLDSIWGNDPQAIEMLQEFFGFIVSGRKHPQKIPVIWGPTRSGKGVISRVLTQLIGEDNVAAPSMAQFTQSFGLWSLIGKPLAIVGDARTPGRDSSTITERLLSISGGDRQNVGRKNKSDWIGELPTRFLICSNEPPTLHDSSGVIADRYVLLRTTRSYLGEEDPKLEEELADELPGILNWALDGLERLSRNDQFTHVRSGDALTESIRDAASPIGEFVREMCVTGPQRWVAKSDLFSRWKEWCDVNEHRPGSSARFTTLLHSVVQDLDSDPPRPHGTPRRYGGIGLNPVPLNQF
ncbi:putative DNA primase/helicase [Streptomyces africanus]|uniref:DNA primase/helicase n=1 Tax=Streptomyces africanus TaxID=231024 RepID=A0ABU0QJ00_9ACTN|nr:phage/plasmid primase, P4 family [Streptomyces africanus]MDQ0746905.1 putative DNA primase/helicase [Streptomyces africanus]